MDQYRWNMRTLMRFGKLRGKDTIEESVKEMFIIFNLFSEMGSTKRQLTFDEIDTMTHALMASNPKLTEEEATEICLEQPGHVAYVLNLYAESLPRADKDAKPGKPQD